MNYRESAEEPRPRRVIEYGPFARRWIEALIGTLGGVLLLFVALTAPRSETLRCSRGEGTCTHVLGSPILADRAATFPIDGIAEVRFSETKEKGGNHGRTVLIGKGGREVSIFRDKVDRARGAHQQIQSFFRDPSQPSAELVWPASYLSAVFFVPLALFAFAVGASAWKRPSSIRLIVDAKTLTVQRRWLGVPLASRTYDATHVKKVRVERGILKTFAQRSSDAGTPAGRLVVEGASETIVLTPLLPGEEAHERVAAQLLAALRGEEPPGVPDAQGDAPSQEPPRAVVSGTPWHKNGTVRFIALIMLLAVVGQTTLMVVASQTQGALDVTCEGRCRMSGAECLPGGAWSGTFDPGRYTIDVWNPNVPGLWEPAAVQVELGKTTRFVCRAGASARVTGPSD